MNLLTNSIKFTSNGFVRLGYSPNNDGNNMTFIVEDTGIGIAHEHKKVIFERFRQGDESLAKKYGGTGLGLTICKNLVQLLGGQINVDSVPGKGAKFTFSIHIK